MPKIKRKDMENLSGLMEDVIEVNGLMESNTEKDHIKLVQDKKNMVNGKKVNVLDGSVEENLIDQL